MRTKKEISSEYKDLLINDSELIYIFTIDLEGRFNGVGKEFDTAVLRKDIDAEWQLASPEKEIAVIPLTDGYVGNYIDKHYLESTTPLRWFFSKLAQKRIVHKAIEVFGASIPCNENCNHPEINNECREQEKFYRRIKEKGLEPVNIPPRREKDVSLSLPGIEIKLFSQGSISIILRVKCDSIISSYDCIADIRYPENNAMNEDECFLGPMNKFAKYIAYQAYVKLLNHDRFIDFEPILNDRFYSYDENNKSLKDVLLFKNKLKKGKKEVSYNKFKEKAQPYVGLICSSLTEVKENGEKEKCDLFGKKDETAQKLILALANNTPEFLKHFNEPRKYLLDNNLARGEEILLIERRGWIIVSPRLNDSRENENEKNRFRRGIVTSLTYSIESIFSTTYSIESFNENLESVAAMESRRFNILISKIAAHSGNLLYRFYRKVFKLPYSLNNFVSIIARARSLSPCEDITTSMEAHVKSKTSIKAIKKLKTFGMTELIKLARMRMRNYGYFLQTGHQIIMDESRKFQNTVLIFLTILGVIIAIANWVPAESLDILQFFG